MLHELQQTRIMEFGDLDEPYIRYPKPRVILLNIRIIIFEIKSLSERIFFPACDLIVLIRVAVSLD